ncbi:Protein RTM1 [Lachnellula hyalina]|uniref:Protein RTM1 n=1 Tax=Lachnellula hyalina TaxID=1316788 RepID=A0A8H8RA39_9HELO|nr:Protein RTM1 [Lachnellula hyalina]TVY31151.1 Protein RTM1 [Lachnellula hyalina]
MSDNPTTPLHSYTPYQPNKVLPIVFAVLIALSLLTHAFQNFRYRFWRVTFFVFYANMVFMTGWILRAVFSHTPLNLALYIGQTILIYAGPPIFAAAEYNILGRLMQYVPMHTPLHPDRVVIVFVYLGALVEALTGAGAGKLAKSTPGTKKYINGGTLIAISLVLQGVIECAFVSLVALIHYRCARAQMLPRNITVICITLYGTSALVLLRCVFRAIEAFTTYTHSCSGGSCGSIVMNEWYLYAFEAAPMVLYTLWLNLFHPGRFLPRNYKRYLDIDGRTERIGPGWIDERPMLLTVADPFNWQNDARGGQKYWTSPEKYTVCEDGSFALGSASNTSAAEKKQYVRRAV